MAKRSNQTSGSTSAAEVMLPMLTEAQQLRAKIEADQRALAEEQVRLVQLETTALKTASPELRERILARAAIDTAKVDAEVTRINNALAVVEARLTEVTAKLIEVRAQKEHYRQIAEPALQEFRRLNGVAIKLDSIRKETLSRIRDHKIQLSELTGEPAPSRK